MTKTEYLFGFPKEKYKGLANLAIERINDAKELRKQLQAQVKYYPKFQNKFQEYLAQRIRKVTEAIETWEKILEIEKY